MRMQRRALKRMALNFSPGPDADQEIISGGIAWILHQYPDKFPLLANKIAGRLLPMGLRRHVWSRQVRPTPPPLSPPQCTVATLCIIDGGTGHGGAWVVDLGRRGGAMGLCVLMLWGIIAGAR